MRRGHADQPMLITSAPQSNDEEYDRRRKKYAIMMTIRGFCVLAAALTYHLSVAVALVFVVGGMFLPWCAVLIANDGPVKKRQPDPGFLTAPVERGLPRGEDDRTVDG
jgi:Flp pilus assembly protein TadB